MEQLVFNTASRSRTVKEGGKTYLVVPMTMLRPQVLNGSKGPLYYPPGEIVKSVKAWNRVPLTLNHPTHPDGRPASSRDPGVRERLSLGEVRNPHIIGLGKLKAEGWFDADRTKRIAPDVYNALKAHRPVELSTGLFTDNEIAQNGSSYLGKSYTHVARNYRPDHLAILPNQKGACGIQDGCGVLVNGASVYDAPPLQRELLQRELLQEKECSCREGRIDNDALAQLALEEITGNTYRRDQARDSQGRWTDSVSKAEMMYRGNVYEEEAREILQAVRAVAKDVDQARLSLQTVLRSHIGQRVGNNPRENTWSTRHDQTVGTKNLTTANDTLIDARERVGRGEYRAAIASLRTANDLLDRVTLLPGGILGTEIAKVKAQIRFAHSLLHDAAELTENREYVRAEDGRFGTVAGQHEKKEKGFGRRVGEYFSEGNQTEEAFQEAHSKGIKSKKDKTGFVESLYDKTPAKLIGPAVGVGAIAAGAGGLAGIPAAAAAAPAALGIASTFANPVGIGAALSNPLIAAGLIGVGVVGLASDSILKSLYPQTFDSLEGVQRRAEMAIVLKRVFAVSTLGAGPIAVEAARSALRYSPNLFRLLLKGAKDIAKGVVKDENPSAQSPKGVPTGNSSRLNKAFQAQRELTDPAATPLPREYTETPTKPADPTLPQPANKRAQEEGQQLPLSLRLLARALEAYPAEGPKLLQAMEAYLSEMGEDVDGLKMEARTAVKEGRPAKDVPKLAEKEEEQIPVEGELEEGQETPVKKPFPPPKKPTLKVTNIARLLEIRNAFEEAKHKRDEAGRFASGGGGEGGQHAADVAKEADVQAREPEARKLTAGLGTLAGAAMGTMVAPGVGTVIGAGLGAAAGLAAGYLPSKGGGVRRKRLRQHAQETKDFNQGVDDLEAELGAAGEGAKGGIPSATAQNPQPKPPTLPASSAKDEDDKINMRSGFTQRTTRRIHSAQGTAMGAMIGGALGGLPGAAIGAGVGYLGTKFAIRHVQSLGKKKPVANYSAEQPRDKLGRWAKGLGKFSLRLGAGVAGGLIGGSLARAATGAIGIQEYLEGSAKAKHGLGTAQEYQQDKVEEVHDDYAAGKYHTRVVQEGIPTVIAGRAGVLPGHLATSRAINDRADVLYRADLGRMHDANFYAHQRYAEQLTDLEQEASPTVTGTVVGGLAGSELARVITGKPTDARKLNLVQRGLRGTGRFVGGAFGGVLGGTLGAGIGTSAGFAGTVLGGAAGGILGGDAGRRVGEGTVVAVEKLGTVAYKSLLGERASPTATRNVLVTNAFSPNQPRDNYGRWVHGTSSVRLKGNRTNYLRTAGDDVREALPKVYRASMTGVGAIMGGIAGSPLGVGGAAMGAVAGAGLGYAGTKAMDALAGKLMSLLSRKKKDTLSVKLTTVEPKKPSLKQKTLDDVTDRATGSALDKPGIRTALKRSSQAVSLTMRANKTNTPEDHYAAAALHETAESRHSKLGEKEIALMHQRLKKEHMLRAAVLVGNKGAKAIPAVVPTNNLIKIAFGGTHVESKSTFGQSSAGHWVNQPRDDQGQWTKDGGGSGTRGGRDREDDFDHHAGTQPRWNGRTARQDKYGNLWQKGEDDDEQRLKAVPNPRPTGPDDKYIAVKKRPEGYKDGDGRLWAYPDGAPVNPTGQQGKPGQAAPAVGKKTKGKGSGLLPRMLTGGLAGAVTGGVIGAGIGSLFANPVGGAAIGAGVGAGAGVTRLGGRAALGGVIGGAGAVGAQLGGIAGIPFTAGVAAGAALPLAVSGGVALGKRLLTRGKAKKSPVVPVPAPATAAPEVVASKPDLSGVTVSTTEQKTTLPAASSKPPREPMKHLLDRENIASRGGVTITSDPVPPSGPGVSVGGANVTVGGVDLSGKKGPSFTVTQGTPVPAAKYEVTEPNPTPRGRVKFKDVEAPDNATPEVQKAFLETKAALDLEARAAKDSRMNRPRTWERTAEAHQKAAGEHATVGSPLAEQHAQAARYAEAMASYSLRDAELYLQSPKGRKWLSGTTGQKWLEGKQGRVWSSTGQLTEPPTTNGGDYLPWW